MARAPSKSMRPRPRPSTREEREAGRRGNRQPSDMTRREMESEAGMKKGGKVGKMAYGGKMKSKKMAKGGMCRGMGAATRGGKYRSS